MDSSGAISKELLLEANFEDDTAISQVSDSAMEKSNAKPSLSSAVVFCVGRKFSVGLSLVEEPAVLVFCFFCVVTEPVVVLVVAVSVVAPHAVMVVVRVIAHISAKKLFLDVSTLIVRRGKEKVTKFGKHF